MIKFIYLETYGCTANQNNSEIMKGLLRQAGLDLVESEKIADIIVLNTCIVKGPTENSIKRRIQNLEKLGKPIIVAGCMPQVRKKWLQRKNIFLLGIKHTKEITKLIRKIIENNYNEREFLSDNREVKLNCSKIRQNKVIGITQISEGCLGNCSFCITKIAKGNLFSYPEEMIVENVRKDIEQGCKEIWITSQDNAAYGLDSGTNLPSLLRKLISLEGKFKIRIGMMNPDNIFPIIDELIEIFKSEKVYKFLHLPLQSGSNKILKLMNRRYTSEQYKEIIKKFKKEIPSITISTDIIAGFPDESEKDFQETLSIIEKIKPDVMNISKYWAMKSTRAAEMNQVSVKEAKKRVGEMQKLHLKISLENNKKLEGKEILVFVSEQQGTNCLARDENYRLVIIRTEKNLLGKKVKVKIIRAFPHYLLGKML